ncbi:GNAT family N-acetyltransferase [Nocardioides sp. Soil805]|uniref:GNAT family N-acetyltransferase n=1 Tax=Nocardioides sp. Soil805 TaxID=1736416 RepID=UPI0007032803|nr:GNAT family N-acetyltransferase [Nocardioides sp. Soil805]KRF34642.1 acetyltransferase [Nocardioides sp. Soil805]
MLVTPGVESLAVVIEEMRTWAYDPDLAALHVGDLGWNHQFGAQALAAALRVWQVDDRLAAVGLLDEPELLRLTVAPGFRHDEDFVRDLVADLDADDGRVLPAGEVALEARFGGPLHDLLLGQGWEYDEPWTPLVRDLSEEVPEHHLRVEDVDPDRLDDRLAVHQSAFDRSTFTAERWRALTQGPAYSRARSLVGYDEQDDAVAMVTVWAGRPGGPGELEPMGVARDHRGRGHGRAICLAAAAALQEMGCSHAFVSTASSNVGAVATYRAAGYEEKPQVRDLRRSAPRST